MNKISRRFAAGLTAASLSLAVVACSDAEDAANNAGDAAKDAASQATDKAGEAANDAKDKAGEATDKAGDAANDAKDKAGDTAADASDKMSSDDSKDGAASGEMKKINTPAGEVEVPAALASAIDEKSAEWGDVQDVENSENGSLATFAEDKLIAFNEESGAQPIIGKIAETWKSEGGLANKVGLPTAPEQAEGNGWVQEFTNGTIKWMKGESGQYEATVE